MKPYQPDGIWELSTSGRGVLANYVQDHGEKLYRRGMYNFIKRTVPPPVMLMFDASNRQTCRVRLAVTSTPLHALTTLNDVTWAEAAGHLERIAVAGDDAALRPALQHLEAEMATFHEWLTATLKEAGG